jgi:hypothetical protein
MGLSCGAVRFSLPGGGSEHVFEHRDILGKHLLCKPTGFRRDVTRASTCDRALEKRGQPWNEPGHDDAKPMPSQ